MRGEGMSRSSAGYEGYSAMKAVMDLARRYRKGLSDMEREAADAARGGVKDGDVLSALAEAREALGKAKKGMDDVAAMAWGWMSERERGFVSVEKEGRLAGRVASSATVGAAEGPWRGPGRPVAVLGRLGRLAGRVASSVDRTGSQEGRA